MKKSVKLHKLRYFLLYTTLLATAGITSASDDQQHACEGEPVYLLVSGVTLDRARMGEYARRIRESGIYQELGAYYVNQAVPTTVLEGDVPEGYASLIVRFPCLANAKRFWNSKLYQNTIRPLRLNPSAGDYLVTVHAESALPDYMTGKVGAADYLVEFDGTRIETISTDK